MPHYFHEHKGFIRGRGIRDCISLTSEMANWLHRKTLGGNTVLKVDTTKAFDTLSWNFIVKVLNQFGFGETLCIWVKSILSLSSVSISINGQQHGFLKCQRGVRKRDPLSPMLFCILEDVLNRGLYKLVFESKIKLMKASRNLKVPSHIFYADDIILF